jgi:transposase-like protein
MNAQKAGAKTLTEIATEYDVHRRTFYRWLKQAGIVRRGGRVTPTEQGLIYQTLAIQDLSQRKTHNVSKCPKMSQMRIAKGLNFVFVSAAILRRRPKSGCAGRRRSRKLLE